MYDIEWLRRIEFPLSRNEIYFNHASISPLPTRTRQRMEEVLRCLAEQPWSFFKEEGESVGESIKRDLAKHVNAADAQEIVQITSTSGGLAAVANAMEWRSGDNVLFCEVEFPSNAYPWLSLERRGVEVRQVPAVDGGLTLDALLPLVDEGTRLIAASAVQFLSGHRTNLSAIGAFARAREIIFVVDAIQAIGHLPIDVQAMNIDVLASGGQKSLLAAPGTGFMYVRDAFCQTLRPQPPGPNATRDFLHWLEYDLEPLPGAERFNMGTWNLVGWFGLQKSVQLLQDLGIENIDRHTSALAAEAIAMLQRKGFEVVSRPGNGPIATFKSGLSEGQTEALVSNLLSQGVTVVKHLDASSVPHIRLSFHAYNTREELHRFADLLDEGMRQVKKGD